MHLLLKICKCFDAFTFENVCSALWPQFYWVVVLLTCPSSPLLGGLCVWQGSKWDDSQISGASLFVSDSTELWKANPQQKYTCLLFNVSLRKNYSLEVDDETRKCNSFDKRRLNIGKKETLSPSPCNNSFYEKFPHNSSQNYTQLQYELHPIPLWKALYQMSNTRDPWVCVCV